MSDENGNEIVWIACSDLRLPANSYQREPNPKTVEAMAANFNESLLQVLDIAGAEAPYDIVDGGHRWSAAVIARGEHYQLPCRVHRTVAEAEQAAVFIGINTGRKQLRALELHTAYLRMGEATAKSIEAAAAATGFHIGPTGIQSPAAMRKVIEWYGEGCLTDALAVCAKAWGTDVRPTPEIIAALARIVAIADRVIDLDDLAEVVATRSYRQWILLADEDRLARTSVAGGDRAARLANKIIQSYNRGRKGNARLPEFRQSRKGPLR